MTTLGQGPRDRPVEPVVAERLAAQLRRWAAVGLLTDDQVTAILAAEEAMGTAAQTRRLYRSRTDRKLAGVCGGLANTSIPTRPDPVLFVVLALLGGPGLVIYLLMWILVPEEPQGTA